jgi:hypothetical protein
MIKSVDKWYWDNDKRCFCMEISNNSKLEIKIDQIWTSEPYLLFKIWCSIKDNTIHVRCLGRYKTFTELNRQVKAWLGDYK